MIREIWYYICKAVFPKVSLGLFVNSVRFIQSTRKFHVFYKIQPSNPLSLNDFLHNEKLNDKYFQFSNLADKYLVRDFVQKRIGANYLIPLIGVFDNPRDLLHLDVQDGLIVKANHGSGWNLICHSSEEVESGLRSFQSWMDKNAFYLSREKQYFNIEPKLVVEKLIADNPIDYKIFCVNGIPKVIQVDSNRFSSHKRDFYSIDWEKLDFQFIYPNSKRIHEAPKGLDEILSIAKTLSQGMDFVRVDLYYENEKVYFGELTFCPEGGMGFFRNYAEDIRFAKYIGLK